MNADLSTWQVSKVTTLYSTFRKAAKFVGNGLQKWNTESVTSLLSTFNEAGEMNADLSTWQVSKVTTLEETFRFAAKFVGRGLEKWNTGSLTNLHKAFYAAGEMNADLGGWHVSKVVTLDQTFKKAAKFVGRGLEKWNTGSLTNLQFAFHSATKFIGTGLNAWDVAKVSAMSETFKNADSLTSCNKRLIADALSWNMNSAFDETYRLQWVSDECPPCVAGKYTDGFGRCIDCKSGTYVATKSHHSDECASDLTKLM